MKKHFFISSLILLSSTIFLYSCKKSDKPQEQNVEALLINKNWKLVAFTAFPAIDLGNGPTNNVLGAWDDCDKDNLFIFKANNVFVYDEGTLKCDPGYPQQKTSTWSYDKGSKLLNYCVGNGTSCDQYTWTLAEINDNTFKATTKEPFNGTTYTLSVTFQKQ